MTPGIRLACAIDAVGSDSASPRSPGKGPACCVVQIFGNPSSTSAFRSFSTSRSCCLQVALVLDRGLNRNKILASATLSEVDNALRQSNPPDESPAVAAERRRSGDLETPIPRDIKNGCAGSGLTLATDVLLHAVDPRLTLQILLPMLIRHQPDACARSASAGDPHCRFADSAGTPRAT